MGLANRAYLEAQTVKGEKKNLPEDENALGNVDPEELSTNQEAAPVPWFCGTRRIGLRWISPVMNQYHQKAEGPGGKGGK